MKSYKILSAMAVVAALSATLVIQAGALDVPMPSDSYDDNLGGWDGVYYEVSNEPAISSTPSVSYSTSGYYNASSEAGQIRSFINKGLYLEAIRDSENTIAWHNLSPEDVTIFSNFKGEAEQKYNDYVNGAAQKSYYNASAEVNQIRSFINQGLYYEAMAECDQTIAWHDLSADDINIINGLKNTANEKLNSYQQSVNAQRSAEKVSAVNDIRSMWNSAISSGISEAQAKQIAMNYYKSEGCQSVQCYSQDSHYYYIRAFMGANYTFVIGECLVFKENGVVTPLY